MVAADRLRVRTYAPNSVMPPHSHDAASLNVVVTGDFTEQVERSERHYAAGYATFSPAGVTHAQQFGPSGVQQIVIGLDEIRLSYFRDSRLPLDESPFAMAPLFHRIGRQILSEMNDGSDLDELACDGLVLELVAAFGRTDTAHPLNDPPRWLRAARDFLHSNARSLPTMKQIARAAGRHEIHLAREFRRYFGTSIGGYLRRLKTQEAARRLRQSRDSITGIAHACGFASHAHLCRIFKAQFGVTPTQYREGR